MSNTVLRRVICFFFSFILSFSLFVLSIAITMQSSVLSKDFLINQLSISGYHLKAADYTKNSISDLAFAGGVPSDVFDEIVTPERVKTDIYNIFEYAYDGKQYSIDSEKLNSEFLEAIKNYASENNIEITAETETNISHLADLCTQSYLDCINIAGINTVIGALRQTAKFMGFAIGGSILIALISIIMLFLINKYKHKFLRYIAYALSGNFLMMTVIPGLLLLTKPYVNLNISPDYLHSFINSFLDDTLKMMLVGAAVTAVLYIIVLVLVGHFKKRAIKKGYKERNKNNLV